jgi:hypothetical protein
VDTKERDGWLRPHRKSLLCLGLILLLPCSCCCLVFEARRPARQVAEAQVIRADGATHTFTLWRAEPLIPLPFFDTAHSWVEWNGRWVKLHGNQFGSAPGDVLISPDGSEAIYGSRFEGADRAIYRFDLRTGKRKRVKGWSKDYEQEGWHRLEWRPLDQE